MVKNLPANARDVRDVGLIPGSGRSPGGGHTTHSSVLAWRIPWTEEPGRLQSMESQRVGHDRTTQQALSTHTCRERARNNQVKFAAYVFEFYKRVSNEIITLDSCCEDLFQFVCVCVCVGGGGEWQLELIGLSYWFAFICSHVRKITPGLC